MYSQWLLDVELYYHGHRATNTHLRTDWVWLFFFLPEAVRSLTNEDVSLTDKLQQELFVRYHTASQYTEQNGAGFSGIDSENEAHPGRK